jgi:DNA-binding NtrC family response regulator
MARSPDKRQRKGREAANPVDHPVLRILALRDTLPHKNTDFVLLFTGPRRALTPHSSQERPMPKLEIHKARQFYKDYVFPDADVVLLGRTRSSDIFLPDHTRQVSRLHAALVRMSAANNQYFVRDLGSTHGTRVNGSAVHQRILQDGDAIEIGKYRLIFSTANHAKSQRTRIRVVQGSSTGSFADASTSALYRSEAAQQFTPEQRELLEQLEGKFREATLLDCAPDLVSAVLHTVRADRGFVGILSEHASEVIAELGVTNMGEHDEIEISDHSFIKHLLAGETVQESNTLLVPFGHESGGRGFLCANRRNKRKPFSPTEAEFLLAVVRLMPLYKERGAADSAGSDISKDGPIEWPMEMLGRSSQFTELIRQIDAATAARMNVLILGESGSGKELVARRLHQRSSSAEGLFLARNCSQTTETLAETEIFGYAPKSGITGADPKGAPGWFELADGGTLFLDEVHRLTPPMQDKFLRVLQDKQVWRIGAKSPVHVDVNVLAATDEDLDRALEQGEFRRPFLSRFGARISVPALRERSEDIPLLAYFFLDKYAATLHSHARTISRRGLHVLWKHGWPGNVRQLEHTVQAAVARDHEVIFSWDLVALFPSQSVAGTEEDAVARAVLSDDVTVHKRPKHMEEVEKEHIQEALEATRGNITRAAEILGYKSRQTMLNKMDRYGIPRNYADPRLPQ